MTKDFVIRRHTVRLVTTSTDFGSGMFRPGLHLFLKGPNGSINGVGPKGFPLHMRIRKLRARYPRLLTYGWHRRYPGHMRNAPGSLYVPIPHLRWREQYKLRWIPGIHSFGRLQYRLAKRYLGR
jgi:hypothetical protein